MYQEDLNSTVERYLCIYQQELNSTVERYLYMFNKSVMTILRDTCICINKTARSRDTCVFINKSVRSFLSARFIEWITNLFYCLNTWSIELKETITQLWRNDKTQCNNLFEIIYLHSNTKGKQVLFGSPMHFIWKNVGLIPIFSKTIWVTNFQFLTLAIYSSLNYVNF